MSDYVDDIYETLIETPRPQLKEMQTELESIVPEPMCFGLDKESKLDAMSKHRQRKSKETTIVPPTCTGKKYSK